MPSITSAIWPICVADARVRVGGAGVEEREQWRESGGRGAEWVGSEVWTPRVWAHVEVDGRVQRNEEERTDDARDAGARAPAREHRRVEDAADAEVEHLAARLEEPEHARAGAAEPEAPRRRRLVGAGCVRLGVPRRDAVGDGDEGVAGHVAGHDEREPFSVGHAADHEPGREEDADHRAERRDVDDQRLVARLAKLIGDLQARAEQHAEARVVDDAAPHRQQHQPPRARDGRRALLGSVDGAVGLDKWLHAQ